MHESSFSSKALKFANTHKILFITGALLLLIEKTNATAINNNTRISQEAKDFQENFNQLLKAPRESNNIDIICTEAVTILYKITNSFITDLDKEELDQEGMNLRKWIFEIRQKVLEFIKTTCLRNLFANLQEVLDTYMIIVGTQYDLKFLDATSHYATSYYGNFSQNSTSF